MNLLPGAYEWLPLDTWTVVVGSLCAVACALPGCYLVLRRMSMMGDAISHAVLPGLAAAFLLSGSRDNLTMLAGAAAVGVLTVLATEWLRAGGRVEHSAAMGVVFSVLFALGLVLIRQAADRVDLDPDCVLYGSIETVVMDTVRVGGLDVPRAALVMGGMLLVNVTFILLFYKELKVSTFDPSLATTLGIHAGAMHVALMMLVALTAVAAFESVGSILVVAMLVAPPAAAHLLTDRLSRMLLLSTALAALSAGVGHVLAIRLPPLLGFPGVSTSSAGMIGVAAGLLLLLAVLFGPRHGLVSRAWRRFALQLRIAREDILGLLYRLEERDALRSTPLTVPMLRTLISTGPLATRWSLAGLRRAGLVESASSASPALLRLTPKGRQFAQQHVRTHRLWEVFLEQYLSLPADHVHAAAEQLEHIRGERLRADLAESVGDPALDPHGKRIPKRDGA